MNKRFSLINTSSFLWMSVGLFCLSVFPSYAQISTARKLKPDFEETFDQNRNWEFNGNYTNPNFNRYPGIRGWENGAMNGDSHPNNRPYLNIVNGIVFGCSSGYGGKAQSFEPTIIHKPMNLDGTQGFCVEFRAISDSSWPNSVTVFIMSDWRKGAKKLNYYGFNIYGESSNHTIDIHSSSVKNGYLYRHKVGRLVNSWHIYSFTRSRDGAFYLSVDGQQLKSFKPPKDRVYDRFNRIALSTLREGSKIDWIKIYSLQDGYNINDKPVLREIGHYYYQPGKNQFGECLKEARNNIKSSTMGLTKPKKDEFETTAQFEQRERKYEQELKSARYRAIQVESNIQRVYSGHPVKLGSYDADKQRFSIYFDELDRWGGWIRINLLLQNRSLMTAAGHESKDLRKKWTFFVEAPVDEARRLRKISDEGKLRMSMDFQLQFDRFERETVLLKQVRLETSDGHRLRVW